MKDLLPTGTQMVNSNSTYKGCFSASVAKDYVYVDSNSNSFKQCLFNCKKCTKANDCQLCGNANNPTKKYYLIQNTSPNQCKTSCTTGQDRFLLQPSSDREFDCVQCDETTFYMDGTNPAQCVACDGEGQSRIGKGCYQCGSGCGNCEV